MPQLLRDIMLRADKPIALLDLLQPLLLLALRLYVASVFIHSGFVKIGDWESTVALFTDEYQVPFLPPLLAAIMGTAGELILPPLLALGLAGRFAAIGLFIVNATAVVSYPALFEFSCPAAIQSHYFWGALLLMLAAFGPGLLSVDAWLKRRLPQT